MSDSWNYPVLLPGTALHACLICGAAVPTKGVDIHDQWHENAPSSAIEALRRLDAHDA